MTMVTGWEEAVAVYNDEKTFSSCLSVTGPFPGFPVPLEGDDVTELIEKHRDELPFSDQLPTLDPPVHTNHRSLMMRLITPEAPQGERGRDVAARRRGARHLPRAGQGRVHQGLREPVHAAGDRRPARASRRRTATPSSTASRTNSGGGVGSTSKESLSHSPLEFLYGQFEEYVEDRRRNPRDDILTGPGHRELPRRHDPDAPATSRGSPPTSSRRARRRRSDCSARR